MNNGANLLKLLRTPAKIEKIRIGGLDVNYLTAGEGFPIIMIHGATIGWGQWLPNIDRLAQHFKIYALDLPGSGASSAIDFKRADLTRDFVDAVSGFISTKNLVGVHLIGHSFGAWLAVKVAQKNSSIKKLVLVSPMGFDIYVPWRYKLMSLYPLAFLVSKTAMRPTKKNMKKFLTGVMEKAPAIPEEFVDYFYQNVAHGGTTHPLIFVNRMSGFFKIKKELYLKETLPKIGNESLVILGTNDPLIDYVRTAKVADTLPFHSIKTYPGTGHVPPTEQSERFNEDVIAFLNNGNN